MAETIKKHENIEDAEEMEKARAPEEEKELEKVPENADELKETQEKDKPDKENSENDDYAEAPPKDDDGGYSGEELEIVAGKETPKEAKTESKVDISWEPKTNLGQKVKSGKIKNIDEILNKNRKILEPEIIDSLINIHSELISLGQSKGKFGGGKRRAWRQTQKKTKEGNVPTFSAMAVVGDGESHVGVGVGKATETLPARDKAIRKAKLNTIKVIRECASFDCACAEKHTVPFQIEGKSGSVRVVLIPAAQGTGLVVGSELKKVLKLAGIEDVYSKTFGKKRTAFNLVKACIEALKKTNPVYEKDEKRDKEGKK